MLTLAVEMLDGAGFRADPDAWPWVLDVVVGVAERLVGVFALAAAPACCLDDDDLPLAGGCFVATGELERVETGLA